MEVKPKPYIDNDPIDGSDTSNVATKRCQDCYALLPISEFGLAKWTQDGYRTICKLCRNEARREYWNKRFGHKKKYNSPEILRSLKAHNERVMAECIPHKGETLQIMAFDVVTKEDYKVIFGPDPQSGFQAMSVIKLDGSFCETFLYLGPKAPENRIKAILKDLNLRLELTDVDVINSKTLIYYL